MPYANLAVCAEAVTISMKGETASERNSRPSLPSHDKIRYEILSSHGIEGKIIVDRTSIINRFIAIPRKFSSFFEPRLKLPEFVGRATTSSSEETRRVVTHQPRPNRVSGGQATRKRDARGRALQRRR